MAYILSLNIWAIRPPNIFRHPIIGRDQYKFNKENKVESKGRP